MPQAWMMVSPYLSKRRIIASGTAEPPTVMRMPSGSFQRFGSASRALMMPIQIVGTPAVTLTFSPS